MKKILKMQWKLALSVLLCSTFLLPTQGFFWNSTKTSDTEIKKQVILHESIPFSSYDFSEKENLSSITITSLPDAQFGSLYIGEIPVETKDLIGISAISGLVFRATDLIGTTEFEVLPSYADGRKTDSVKMKIEILEMPNEAPLAKDMSLFTYKNIALTCYFDVIDAENDIMSFQITDPPARGAVTIDETGTSSFLYSPYENKTGKDQFKYVVIDSNGNQSNEATVEIRIEKADTTVTYSDLEGHSAHKAAISLAESGIFVGECIGNTYLFHPDEIVTRDEFLSLAMATTQLAPLEEVLTTGFYDDAAIPTWSKGHVSAALLAGVIQGSIDESGKPVFSADSVVTFAEASVILDNLLNVSQVTTTSGEHWASQACANLEAVGVSTNTTLPSGLNRAEVAELLDSVLSLKQEKNSWFHW